jgi:hypothetical protein
MLAPGIFLPRTPTLPHSSYYTIDGFFPSHKTPPPPQPVLPNTLGQLIFVMTRRGTYISMPSAVMTQPTMCIDGTAALEIQNMLNLRLCNWETLHPPSSRGQEPCGSRGGIGAPRPPEGCASRRLRDLAKLFGLKPLRRCLATAPEG